MSFSSLLIRKAKGLPRAVRRRWQETHVSGLEIGQRIRIYDLVCPLRYDISVRADFIRFLVDNAYLSTADFDAISEHPATKAYYTWFKEVAVRRFLPEIYHDDNRVHERFYERFMNVQALWASMRSQGFDHTYPVRLTSGNLVHEVNGKTVDTSFFAGDGCHRIACLLVMGKDVLEPEEYEVVSRAELRPLDNTALLLDKIPISMSDYLSFISRGYCGGRRLASADEALIYVEEHSPDRFAELKNVFRYDLDHLRQP